MEGGIDRARRKTIGTDSGHQSRQGTIMGRAGPQLLLIWFAGFCQKKCRADIAFLRGLVTGTRRVSACLDETR